MSLRDHLYDLRHRLSIALLFVAAGAIFGLFWWDLSIGVIPKLSDIVTGPYCDVPAKYRMPSDRCALLQTTPFEAFLVRFKVGLAVGAVLTSPAWLYQIWAFVAPGLYARERKFARTFVGIASLLFAAGAVLAYVVVPKGLEVLIAFGGDGFITSLKADEYISFILVMLVIFGVSFELPLLIVMLNRIGVLTYAKLQRGRRGLLFGLFVFAAIATPGTDPFSMVALALAMTVLFEVAVQFSRIHDKRKARREAESSEDYSQLDDDDTSPLDHQPEPERPSPAPAGTESATPQADKPRGGYDDVT
jgi:sec-independent protein translocase protein TatC